LTPSNDHQQHFDTDVVIGLEIHITLNTQSKLFCSCSNQFTEEPNKNICPVCLGHPGTRPALNKQALKYAVTLAKALNCRIADRLIFSRKTYFYPDLAKNFQITQYEEPLGIGGFVVVGDRKISLERMHMEEDPGALIHKGSVVLIDYNRSGSPLCEIVTKPDITSPKEAREFVKKLVTIISYLRIFDYDNGVIKADLNVSVRETGYKKVEIKGVSGHKDIEDALEYEIKRQKHSPQEVVQETRGYDSEQKITFSQRGKEDAEDYGYIYEPDIVPRVIDETFTQSIFSGMPEMVDSRIARYTQKGIEKTNAEILASMIEVSDAFDYALGKGSDVEGASNFFKREIIAAINQGTLKRETLGNERFLGQSIALLKLASERKVNNHSQRIILDELCRDNLLDVVKFSHEKKLIVENTLDLDLMCQQAVDNSPDAVNDYRSGKLGAINFIVGQVLKQAKGQAMPDEVKEKIKKILENTK
jgi:aspartyl-tRNA(Asn)/glutamyl-tRNA(Gln) amidotransferase subunit B